MHQEDACLIGIRETSHSAHYAKHVVVDSVHTDLGRQISTDSVVGQCQDECGVINTREVASTRRLVFLRLEGEGVHVDTNGGDVGVVLVRLD